MSGPFHLFRKEGKLFVRFHGQLEEIQVNPVWTRPLTARGRELALVDQSRREVAQVDDPDSLDPDLRHTILSELESRYLIPAIRKILDIRAHMGVLYWSVETNAGSRRFALKDPSDSVLWLSDDRVILRDCTGNRYEIDSIGALDRSSRAKISLVI